MKRVASAVGEGSVAIQLLHQMFAIEDAARDRSEARPAR